MEKKKVSLKASNGFEYTLHAKIMRQSTFDGMVCLLADESKGVNLLRSKWDYIKLAVEFDGKYEVAVEGIYICVPIDAITSVESY